MTAVTTTPAGSSSAATAGTRPATGSGAVPASAVSSRLQARWAGMSGKIGLAFIIGGFLLMIIAWNGAAGLDYTQGQVPYLLSGGVPGLALVIVGSTLLVIESAKRDRALLEQRLDELIAVAGKGGGLAPAPVAAAAPVAAGAGATVVAGRSSFHAPGCHLIESRTDADVTTREVATARGLEACRVCAP